MAVEWSADVPQTVQGNILGSLHPKKDITSTSQGVATWIDTIGLSAAARSHGVSGAAPRAIPGFGASHLLTQ